LYILLIPKRVLIKFTHPKASSYQIYDIPITNKIEEDSIPGKQGMTTAKTTEWVSPAPPFGTHRYFFKIYALDKGLGLKEGLDKKAVEKAMEGHILDKAELIGLYKRGDR
jgi:phosphatidylethanolamine-binding protein (PEBP) family uncharacterized protein